MNKQEVFLNACLKAVFACVLITVFAGPRLFAEDFTASATFDGVTTNTTNVHIGFGVSDITIVVTNGGEIINSGRTQIGYPNAPSSNTTVIVTGIGSLLTNTAQVTIGRLSASNALYILDGGRVYSSSGFMGGQDGDETAAPSNNLAVITGTGSLWNNIDSLIIGRTAGGNQMIITNGGVVRNSVGYIGFDSVAGNNSVIVTDSGSVWTNSSELNIGLSGANNQLTVVNGGQVFASRVDLGVGSTSTGNALFVSGTDATLTSGGELRIGVGGQGNSVTISNGGKVVTASNVNLGFSSNNTLLVTGSGSILSNNSTVTVGRIGANNRMTIENGGVVKTFAGYMGGRDGDEGAGASNNLAVITGTGSLWNNIDSLIIGRTAGGNQMIITNGGRVESARGYVGFDPVAQNNQIIVTGVGSTWSNTANVGIDGLFLGYQGGNNQLIISDGGRVDAYFGILGYIASSTNNSLLVTGNNSLLKLGYELEVGASGNGNQVTISNGGTISNAANANIGWGVSSSNTVLVTGTGSKWNLPGTLTVGRGGSSNLLRIENGGLVESGAGSLGGRDGGDSTITTSNIVIVTGTGSIWTNSDTLSIGATAGGNQLIITNGGRVVSARGYLGRDSTAQNNQVIVTGAGSTWSNLANVGIDGLFLGSAGGNNQLTISDGGRVDAHFGILGYDAPSASNSLLVTGSGSLLKLTSELEVGRSGRDNQVTVSNGGTISNAANANIGWGAASSSNNIVLVTDTGSVWSLPGTLTVGRTGGSNRLEIANGGRVESGAGSLGGRDGDEGAAPSNNIAVVTGSGSIWNNADTLVVGRLTGGNQLIVTNGGRVVNSQGYIGNDAAAQNNRFIVTGAGSTWSNTAAVSLGSLVVGSSGANSQLIVADGGRVDAYEGNIGFGNSASNSSALVTGNNSLLKLSTGLRVGVNSVGNQLIVTNGGTVNAGTWLRVGVGSTSSGSVLVTGQGSTARGGDRMSVGANGDTDGSGSVLVTDNGVLEFNELKAGTGGTISNVGGIYQFTSAGPTVTPSGSGKIAITDGTISYRDVAGVDILNAQVGNMSKAGNNTFQLNNSSNSAVVSYTFDSVAYTGNPTNYQRLVLVNGGSRWSSTTLTTIGTGGELLVSNSAAARVSGVISNAGTINVVHSKMTFENNVILNGSYISDPSTNTYLADVTVMASGSLAGGVGDLFDFKKSFYVNSTNRIDFDLSTSTVLFSGGGVHTNAITGVDLGGGSAAYESSFVTQTNFAYGTLRLESTNDFVCFECGNIPVVASNALYIGYLDLTDLTNDIPNVSTLVTSLLHAPTNINLYYQVGGNNAYLDGLTYQLTDCNNALGGLLMPVIPEPSSLLLFGTAILVLLRKSRRG